MIRARKVQGLGQVADASEIAIEGVGVSVTRTYAAATHSPIGEEHQRGAALTKYDT